MGAASASVIGKAVADACGEMGRMMARTRKMQLSRNSGDGRGFVLLFSISCGDDEEEVLLVVSSSSTQAMMKRGNWKKEERHIVLC